MHRVSGEAKVAAGRPATAMVVASMAALAVVLTAQAITQDSPESANNAVSAGVGSANATGMGPNSNPYLVITNRNAFGIKPPAPPPDPKLSAPPAPPPNLFVTGFSQLRGNKRAFLVMNRPGKSPEFLVVDESYDVDGLKVTAIDPRKETLTVINAGTEVTLNFKDNGLKPGTLPINLPGNGMGPGGPGNPMVRPVPQVFAPGTPGAPTVVRRPSSENLPISDISDSDSASVRPARRGVYTGANNGGGGFNGGYPGAFPGGGTPMSTVADPNPVNTLPPPSSSAVPAAPGVVSNPGSGRTPPPVPYIPR